LKSPLTPPILIAYAPICFAVLGMDVLGKTLAPLHCRGIAEPELLLLQVSCVPAHASDKDCLLLAALAAMIPLALFLE
jgi:hypothetical protein